MPVYKLEDSTPELAADVWIAPDASVIGDVTLGPQVGVWFGAVLRGDMCGITVGAGTNIQEHTMVHVDDGYPAIIGTGCTIGHRAIIHGCTIGDNTLVGMGAIVLNGAVIGDNCLIGAGALVTEGKQIPAGSLVVGSPARVVRDLSPEQIQRLRDSAVRYQINARRFAQTLTEV